ncbi:UDP-glycosyltransferase 76B1 [Sesamum alatum]|uniref:UDP-glycosyltransferase 76B1 n=1 Tax=Sesamum alatum TaxID=300844 RepID=A0AAE1YUY6_9LAMI|nr:UDP-glycosyltransferase 76B1 [Sesamum alatum]
MDQKNRCRLVLFPLPFQGHINPMIQLAKILHSEGFSISIIHTRYNFPDPSNYPHFTFHLISDGLSEAEASKLAILRVIKLLLTNCVEPFEQCLAQILSSEDSDHRVGCVVTDAIWDFTQAAADKLKIPRIVLRTSSVCSFIAFSALPLLRQRYLTDKDYRMEAAVLELPPIKVKDIPRIETHNGEDMYRAIENMVRETKKASGLIFNTFQELEEPELAKLQEQEQFLMPTFAIGPFHKRFSAAPTSLFTQDRSSISWLDARAPGSVLYVSFGSIAAMDQQKMHEMAWGLADSMQPFLWVVRPGLARGSEWLEMLPNEFLEATRDRGHIVKWAPQQEVLSHPAVGGFWTHGGWNSTLESICEGVPMICAPFFGDQMVNSRYVNDVWKIGVRLEKGLERGEIRDAVRRLMVEREGEEMRQRVKCLKEKADLCLNAGGSSYQALDALLKVMDDTGKTILKQKERRRLLLFPVPLQGHINPMIQLAQILHLRGFDVSIIHTKYNSLNLSRYPQFTVHIIPDGLSETEVPTSDVTLFLKRLNINCAGPFHDCLADLLSRDTENPPVAMITDSIWHFTQAAADSFNLPRIVLRATSVCSFLVFAALPQLQEKGYLNNFDSKREEFVVELPPLKVTDIPVFESSENTYQLIQEIVEETKKASGLIFNTFQELERPELFKLQETSRVPTFSIGPFHKLFPASSSSLLTQDRSSITWLDAQAPKSVLYVSFGSLATMDQRKINEVAWGLANSMQPFLWVVRPGLVRGSEWLEILPNEFLATTCDRGYIVKWAPQQEVLAHPAIGGFWTHGGWNSILESICEGVAMICSPLFGDQMVNSRYVSDVWRIGMNLEKELERGKIENGIKKLMIGREGEEIRQRIMCLKERVDGCLGFGGSSYNSLNSLVSFVSSFGSPH